MAEQNFIKQIKLAEDKVYDIATAHNITFTGVGDENVVWNGLSDVTISIPTITDLIDTPVRFAGVVKKDGEGYYVEYNKAKVETFGAGDLVFFSDNISNFETETGTTIACESGDMAVYDGSKWNVVTGEHQVKISDGLTEVNGNVTTAVIGVNSDATEVLDIEGKKLALKVNIGKGGTETISLAGNGTGTVDEKYIKIEKDSTTTATGTCDVPLNDKNVTLKDGLTLVKSVTLPSLSGGTIASGDTNSSAISCNVTGGGISKTVNGNASGDFVDDVDISLSLLDEDKKTNESIKILVDSTFTPTGVDGNAFVTGIHEKKTNETANFITTTFDKSTYISSIGDYISTVTGGSLVDDKYNAVTELLYGLDAEITNGTKGDVVYDVAVTAPTNVLSSATVDTNGVLSLVGESLSITPKYKSFKKATYTAVSSTPGNPTTGSLTKKEYVFDTGKDTLTTYSYVPSYKYLDVEEKLTYGSYSVDNIGVSIPENKVIVNVNGGAFPSLTGGNVVPLGDDEKTIGTVSDNLIGNATATVSVDTYKLGTTTNKDDNKAITVGAAGNVETTVNVSGNINLSGYYCDK